MTQPSPAADKPFDVSRRVEAGGGMDLREHMRTWRGFMRFIVWQIVGAVVILGLLAIFRTHG
ncbi:MAG TPA: aa3-type cytochrome c oxidase subunit IV [Rhizomicrobium sp.]|jgi:hypothetical protein|nr:aa3-type cytochrome c oxidase subunit IV [Rhizomicrobium sp.]HVZ91513.1 aa3-type cytochrome c oxidase subunit IV [Rhizomicrobium sp.]